MKRTELGTGLIVVLLALQPQASQGAVHPSLFYGSDDVPELRNPPPGRLSELKELLRRGATAYVGTNPEDACYTPDRGTALLSFAITCMITNDANICAGAKRWLINIVNVPRPLPGWLCQTCERGRCKCDRPCCGCESAAQPDFNQSSHVIGVSVAYDVLLDPQIHPNGQLNDLERAQVQDRLATEAELIWSASRQSAFWRNTYTQNHNWLNFGALGIAALALKDEVPGADRWLDAARSNFEALNTVLNLIPDGTWHEGFAYEGASLAFWLHFADAHRRAGYRDFTDNDMLRAFPHYRAVASLPGAVYQSVLPHGDFFGWSNDEVLYVLRYAAVRFNDGEAVWLAERQQEDMPHSDYGLEQHDVALDYLLYHELLARGIKAVMPTDVELTLTDLKGQISRSGYDSNAAVLGLKAGPYLGFGNAERFWTTPFPSEVVDVAHDHGDDASFWFFANGQWLAPEAAGNNCHPNPCSDNPQHPDSRFFAGTAEFHNVFTIDGRGQIDDALRRRAYDKSPEHRFPYERRGLLFAHTATERFSYTAIDGTALYPAELNLTSFSRQVFFLDRQIVVVRDVLQSPQPHNYKWHTHAMDGAVCPVGSDNICPGEWIRADSVRGTDKALGIRVVAPVDWQWDAQAQQPWRGEKFDPPPNIMTRVRIWPTQDQPSARFLTVLVPTTISGWASRPAIEPLGDIELARGFLIMDGNTRGRWLFGDGQDSTVSNGQMTLTGVLGGVQDADDGATYLLVRGTALSADGRDVLSGDARDGAIEARVSADTVYITADVATYARVYAPGVTQGFWNGASVIPYPDPDDPDYVWLFAPGKAGQ